MDDNGPILEQMTAMLQRWGCYVIAGSSCDELLAQLEDDPLALELIVSDLRLAGGESGLEVVRRIRAQARPGLPAMIVTGDTSVDAAHEIRSHGLRFVYKPVPPQRLRSLMKQLLEA